MYMQCKCQNATAGGYLKLLIQPGDGVTALLKGINRAKSSVEIAIFRFSHAGIEEALTNAVKRGVLVRALIAHVNGSDAEALRKLEMRLLAAGLTVARTDTDLARYHAKYLIVDRQELFVLAFNFTHQDIDRSRSFGVITRNRKLVGEAVKLFEADMTRKPYKPEVTQFVVSPLNARKQLSTFIKGAKSELVIYDPRISDPELIRLLQERAKANVAVRIIGRVADKNVPLAVRRLGRMRLHTRSLVRDRKSLFVGSQSLRELELDGRREVGIVSKDRRAVAAVLKMFEEDWAMSEQSAAAADESRPVAKVAKKIAKTLSKELPRVGPVLDRVLKQETGGGADLKVDADEIEETVREAVKHVVRTVVEQTIEQKIEVPSDHD
jgi:phosphatidylserine/phosphatidylglycerophosphate/cardiolipin synthase-like enzyme